MNTLSLNIVTPNGSVYTNDQVEMVILQTETGEMGVMAGHIPMVAPLKIGIVRTNKGKEKDYIAVTEGFAEVRPSGVTVLVQAAEQAEEIDIERAKESLSRAQERLAHDKQADVDYARAEQALFRAMNRLDVAKFR